MTRSTSLTSTTTLPWIPRPVRPWVRFDNIALLVLAAIGAFPFSEELTILLIYAILALGLNVVTGYTGLLHLGIAAFFGIGAYITGILTVAVYPFQVGFCAALVLSTLGAALAGLMLGAPTLRLRGDYLAIVTMGFGEVTRYMLKNFEEITKGSRTLSPIPPPMPGWTPRNFFFLALAILAVVIILLRNLERSRLGRAWMAIREDELAATCMGVNATKVKLSAFALGAALAGLAGSLYATLLGTTAGPDAFDFSRSVITLSCIILGGLGSIRGTLLGVLLLIGFDQLAASRLDASIADMRAGLWPDGNVPAWAIRFISFSNWRLMLFGIVLVVMMRFRPEGLLPSARVREELHPKADSPAPAPAGSSAESPERRGKGT